MRIDQCFSAFGHFGPQLREKYQLNPYRIKDEPSLFYGIYGSQVNKVLAHKSIAVLLWSGSDCADFANHPDRISALKAKANVYHIAKSKFIFNTLASIGIESHHIPITTNTNDDLKPEPLGDAVYLYKGHSEQYGRSYNEAVMDAYPDLEYIQTDLHSYNREELIEVYKKCFIGLRCIAHDGLSHTVIEMGLLGRPVIWNGGTPNALHYDTVEGVVAKFGMILAMKDKIDTESIADSMVRYLDIGTDWLDTDYYLKS